MQCLRHKTAMIKDNITGVYTCRKCEIIQEFIDSRPETDEFRLDDIYEE